MQVCSKKQLWKEGFTSNLPRLWNIAYLTTGSKDSLSLGKKYIMSKSHFPWLTIWVTPTSCCFWHHQLAKKFTTVVRTADMLQGRADIQRHLKRLQEEADWNPSQNSTRMDIEPATWDESSLAMLEAGKCLSWKGPRGTAWTILHCSYHAFNPNKSHKLYEQFFVFCLV